MATKKTKKSKFNKIKSHKFPQGEYRIVWREPKIKNEKWDGYCESPDTKDRKILINPNVEEFDLMRIAIDEGCHASFWVIDNDEVDKFSQSMAEFLWSIGFRLQKPDIE